MNGYIWHTESVDTSAILLAQALGVESGTSAPDKNTPVVFYGVVKDETGKAISGTNVEDEKFCLNLPYLTSKTINKRKVMNTLREEYGVDAVKYLSLNGQSYSDLKNEIGNNKFCLVSRKNMQVVALVTSKKEYDSYISNGHVHYAADRSLAKDNLNGICRVYAGRTKNTTEILGIQAAQLQQMSFMDTLLLNQGEEAIGAIKKFFGEGVLKEDMGSGIFGWSSVKFTAGKDNSPCTTSIITVIQDQIHKISAGLQLDFFAVDFVIDTSGFVQVVNLTASPSLQQEGVLGAVKKYFSSRLADMSTYSLSDVVGLLEGLPEDKVSELGKLLKTNKIFS